jgi:succinoglycan biosynthesis transport protein ExoP
VLRELNNRFDVTIIDCPPVLPVTDAALVAKSLGGAIMVVGSGRVEVRDFRRAVEALETAGAPLLGVVLNYAPQAEIGQYRRMYRREEHVQWDPSATGSSKAA